VIKTKSTRAQTSTRRSKVDYADTATTRRYRRDMRRLNRFLNAADITFIDDGQEPPVDPNVVTLRRHLVVHGDQGPQFDQGGRLFGGFWQNIARERRPNIRINGEPVVELDYGQIFTRLAYAEIGKVPPEGDLYAIPGLEGYRSGVKMVMNTLLFDDHANRKSWPSKIGIGVRSDHDAETTDDDVGYEGHLPTGYGVAKTKKAILKVHPHLKTVWGTSMGYYLMFVESEILMAVMLELADAGVVALGLHDGVIVGRSSTEIAEEVMKRVAHKTSGLDIPVSVKV
jgi:hypothetical protein